MYNALSGKHHTNPDELEITTLENVIYIHKNNCKSLYDYASYVDRIKTNFSKGMDINDSIEEALTWAIKNELLEGYFKEQRAEVLAVSLTEFDQDLYDKCRRREGYEDGVRELTKDIVPAVTMA